MWFYYAWRLTLTVPAGRDLYDFANNLLYADDMRHGNWLLSGWVVTQDPHWLTDDLLYVLGLWVRGFDPVLLHAVPLAVYTVLIVLVGWTAVARLNLSAVERVLVAAVAVLPLVFPSRTLSSQVLVGPYHTATTAVALGAVLAFAFSQPVLRRGAVTVAPIVLGGVLLAVGRIGDPYMLLLGIVPVAVITAYGLLLKPDVAGTRWTASMLSVTCVAWAVAGAILWLVPRIGGFTMRVSLPPIIPLSELVPRVVDFIGTFLNLSGSNFFGLPLGSSLVVAAVRFAYLGAAVWAVGATLKSLPNSRRWDWTAVVLSISVLVSGAAMFLYGPGDYLGDEHRAPVFLLLGIVLARRLAESRGEWLRSTSGRRVAVVGLVCSAVIFAVLPVEQLQQSEGFDDPSHFPQLALAQWLEQHDLRRGYGPYTSASIITVMTRGRVVVRALISTNQYYSLPRTSWRLIPNIELMAKSTWYARDHPGTFLIVDNADVDRQTAMQTFGTPDRISTVGQFQVFEWTKGILCTVPEQTVEVRAREQSGLPPQQASCARRD